MGEKEESQDDQDGEDVHRPGTGEGVDLVGDGDALQQDIGDAHTRGYGKSHGQDELEEARQKARPGDGRTLISEGAHGREGSFLLLKVGHHHVEDDGKAHDDGHCGQEAAGDFKGHQAFLEFGADKAGVGDVAHMLSVFVFLEEVIDVMNLDEQTAARVFGLVFIEACVAHGVDEFIGDGLHGQTGVIRGDGIAHHGIQKISVIGGKDDAVLGHGDGVLILIDDTDEVLIGFDAIDQGVGLLAVAGIDHFAWQILDERFIDDVRVFLPKGLIDVFLGGQVIEIDLGVVIEAGGEELGHHRGFAFGNRKGGENQHAAGEKADAREDVPSHIS